MDSGEEISDEDAREILDEILRLRKIAIAEGAASVETRKGDVVTHVAINARNYWRFLSYHVVTWAFQNDLKHLEMDAYRGARYSDPLNTHDPIPAAILENATTSALGEPGDFVYMALPQNVALKLEDALDALYFGEIPEIFRPVEKPTTAPILRRNILKHLAVRAVSYLEGRGYKKREAESAVGKAFGVNGEAIRKWERSCRNEGRIWGKDYMVAFAAGAADSGVSQEAAENKFNALTKKRSYLLDCGAVRWTFGEAWDRRQESHISNSWGSFKVGQFREAGKYFQKINWKHIAGNRRMGKTQK